MGLVPSEFGEDGKKVFKGVIEGTTNTSGNIAILSSTSSKKIISVCVDNTYGSTVYFALAYMHSNGSTYANVRDTDFALVKNTAVRIVYYYIEE